MVRSSTMRRIHDRACAATSCSAVALSGGRRRCGGPDVTAGRHSCSIGMSGPTGTVVRATRGAVDSLLPGPPSARSDHCDVACRATSQLAAAAAATDTADATTADAAAAVPATMELRICRGASGSRRIGRRRNGAGPDAERRTHGRHTGRSAMPDVAVAPAPTKRNGVADGITDDALCTDDVRQQTSVDLALFTPLERMVLTTSGTLQRLIRCDARCRCAVGRPVLLPDGTAPDGSPAQRIL